MNLLHPTFLPEDFRGPRLVDERTGANCDARVAWNPSHPNVRGSQPNYILHEDAGIARRGQESSIDLEPPIGDIITNTDSTIIIVIIFIIATATSQRSEIEGALSPPRRGARRRPAGGPGAAAEVHTRFT